MLLEVITLPVLRDLACRQGSVLTTCIKLFFVQFHNEINGGEIEHEMQRKIEIQSEIGAVISQFLCGSN